MDNSLRVLLIDNNTADYTLVAHQLRQEFPAAQVESITEARDLSQVLQAGNLGLVITDYHLGWTDGLAVLRAVKAHCPDCPVILFTGAISQEIAKQAVQAGLDSYIPRSPQNLACLTVAVRSALEKALQRQNVKDLETRYRDLFDGVPIGLYRSTPDGKFLNANPALVRLLGYPDPASLLAISATEIYVDPQERRRWQALVEREGAVRDFRAAMRRTDGTVMWTEDNAHAVRDSDGTVLYYEGSLVDITERLRTEKALRESEQKLRGIVEQSPDGIILTDEQGNVIEWNQGQEQITGLMRAEVLGRPLWDVQRQVALDERRNTSGAHERAKASLLEYLKTGQAPWLNQLLEHDIQRPDGARCTIQNLVFPIKTEKGFTIGCTSRDITERVRVTEALRAREEEIEQRNRELVILNEISQAITSSLDMQETLTLITDYTTHLLDVAATSIFLHDEGDETLHFAAGSSMDAEMVKGQPLPVGQGIAGWVAQHGELALVTDTSKDPRWFSGFDHETHFTARSILCVPLKIKGQVIGVLQAINKRSGNFDQVDLRFLSALAAPAATAIEHARLFKQVQSAREQLQALSHRLVEVQETERRNISRELHDETGQILSVLLLSLSLLEREANRPEVVIARAAELAEMVEEMLENLHRLAVNLRPASLDHLGLQVALEQYLGTFQETFSRQYGINVQFEMAGLEGERLPQAVETALYRIVQEALNNVVRHAQATQVDVLLEQRDGKVVLIIEDNGGGFDLQTASQSGRLGLFGMKERAEMLGGILVVETIAGVGTTVLVEVPYVHSHSDR